MVFLVFSLNSVRNSTFSNGFFGFHASECSWLSPRVWSAKSPQKYENQRNHWKMYHVCTVEQKYQKNHWNINHLWFWNQEIPEKP